MARSESPTKDHSPAPNDGFPKRLFMNVIQLSSEDRDIIKLPIWAYKALNMIAGQPLSVSLPKWPGSLHFYDAQRIEIVPMSPSYFTVEQ